MAYEAMNDLALRFVSLEARSVLDLGCGSGAAGAFLKARQPCRVVGVTYDPEEAAAAAQRLDRVEVADLNDFDPASLGTFDCILCSHVLEHLYKPQNLLRRLHDALKPDGTLIVALPNVLFWKQRLLFLRGRFRYTSGGLMDETHFRFFDCRTAAALPEGAEYEIVARASEGGFPLSRFLGRYLQTKLDSLCTGVFPGLFSWQFVMSCRSKLDGVRSGNPGSPAARNDVQ